MEIYIEWGLFYNYFEPYRLLINIGERSLLSLLHLKLYNRDCILREFVRHVLTSVDVVSLVDSNTVEAERQKASSEIRKCLVVCKL